MQAKLGLTVFIWLLSCLYAYSIIATDSFDYMAGEVLNGENGGSGWSTAWDDITHAAEVNYGGLSFPGQSTSGNAALFGQYFQDYVAYRSFTTAIDSANQSSARLSFLFALQEGVEDVGITFAGINLFNGLAKALYFGKLGNSEQIGFENHTDGLDVYGVDIDWNSFNAAFYIYRFDADFTLSPAESTVDVTLSSSLSGNPATVIGNWTNISLGSDFGFEGIQLTRDGAMPGDIIALFDEIEVSAVPEADVYALLITLPGILLFVLYRRKSVDL